MDVVKHTPIPLETPVMRYEGMLKAVKILMVLMVQLLLWTWRYRESKFFEVYLVVAIYTRFHPSFCMFPYLPTLLICNYFCPFNV